MNAIIESYLQGVSTRNVETVISHLGVNQISASYVSKGAQELDEKVHEFIERSIDTYIPFLFVDASYFKVRDGIRYVSNALFIVADVRTDGYREILTFSVADAEHELTWVGIFSDLRERGLSKVDLIISDGHNGVQVSSGLFWKKIRTTNLLKRVNKERKRRRRTIGAFPNDASLLRLAGSILIDINEEWITGNRYLSVKSEMFSWNTGVADFTAL